MLTPQQIKERSLVGKEIEIILEDKDLFPDQSPSLIFEVPQLSLLRGAMLRHFAGMMGETDKEELEVDVEAMLRMTDSIMGFCREVAVYVIGWKWEGAEEYSMSVLLQLFEAEESLASAFFGGINKLYDMLSTSKSELKKSLDIMPDGGQEPEVANVA